MVNLGGTKTLLIDIRDRESLCTTSDDIETGVDSPNASSREIDFIEELIEEHKQEPAKGREKIVKLGLKRTIGLKYAISSATPRLSSSHLLLLPLLPTWLHPLLFHLTFVLFQFSINSATSCERKACQRHSTR